MVEWSARRWGDSETLVRIPLKSAASFYSPPRTEDYPRVVQKDFFRLTQYSSTSFTRKITGNINQGNNSRITSGEQHKPRRRRLYKHLSCINNDHRRKHNGTRGQNVKRKDNQILSVMAAATNNIYPSQHLLACEKPG